jgi:hypothetical protein
MLYRTVYPVFSLKKVEIFMGGLLKNNSDGKINPRDTIHCSSDVSDRNRK